MTPRWVRDHCGVETTLVGGSHVGAESYWSTHRHALGKEDGKVKEIVDKDSVNRLSVRPVGFLRTNDGVFAINDNI